MSTNSSKQHINSEHGLDFDTAVHAWVASSAEAVQAILSHPELRVRPISEPVPPALLGTPAAAIFASLVRMTDGPNHGPLKLAVQNALDYFSAEDIRVSALQIAAGIPLPTPLTGEALTRFNYQLSTRVLAQAFGLPQEDWPVIATEVQHFVRCIAPGGTEAEIKAGIVAADQLAQRIHRQIAAPGPLLQQLMVTIEQSDLPKASTLVVANALGLFFQAYEGCAGLIGMALLRARDDAVHDAGALVEAVIADTPTFQNTRRFVAANMTISGCPFHAGDTILVTLTAKDASSAQNNAFGHGQHACPGSHWARAIATAGVTYLMQQGFDWSILDRYQWRRSPNARVPEFY
jgi:cytochrome P450